MIRPIIVFLLGYSVSHIHGQQPSSIELITTGTFHKDEVKVRTGERWLGLTPGNSGFTWRMSKLVVRAVQDSVVDELGIKTSIEVKVAGEAPVFLLRGANQLTSNSVRTALFSPGGFSLPEREPITLQCNDCKGVYRLAVLDRKLTDNNPPRPSRLVLETDGKKQIICEWPSGLIDQHCELIWAGDLDGDGNLDLFMDLSDHYNVIESTLFLSSKAQPGKLVEKVALLRRTGC